MDFYHHESLNVEIYAARTAELAVIEGDLEFYLELAKVAPGPALELGCGTGRLVIPLAREGIDITGLDLSAPMLAHANRALAREPLETRTRAAFVEGDMTRFHLGREFGLIFIASAHS